MASQNLVEKENYEERFDPMVYLGEFYMTLGSPNNKYVRDLGVKGLHDVFSKWSPETENVSLRVLDYGCGPVICNIMSVAGRTEVSEIVLAEYTARNREAIQKWLDKDPSAFDWSLYFKHVVKTLEGKTDQEVAKREEKMHSLVKLVSCDITADPPIEKGYSDPYDVVISSLCLEVSCNNTDEYRARVARLSSLVKPGGKLLLISTEGQPVGELGYYVLGSETFTEVKLSYDIIASALKEANVNILSINRIELDKDPTRDDCDSFIFINAEKTT